MVSERRGSPQPSLSPPPSCPAGERDIVPLRVFMTGYPALSWGPDTHTQVHSHNYIHTHSTTSCRLRAAKTTVSNQKKHATIHHNSRASNPHPHPNNDCQNGNTHTKEREREREEGSTTMRDPNLSQKYLPTIQLSLIELSHSSVCTLPVCKQHQPPHNTHTPNNYHSNTRLHPQINTSTTNVVCVCVTHPMPCNSKKKGIYYTLTQYCVL